MSRFRFYILPRLCLGLSVLFLLFGGWVLWLSLGRPLPTMGLACRQAAAAELLGEPRLLASGPVRMENSHPEEDAWAVLQSGDWYAVVKLERRAGLLWSVSSALPIPPINVAHTGLYTDLAAHDTVWDLYDGPDDPDGQVFTEVLPLAICTHPSVVRLEGEFLVLGNWEDPETARRERGTPVTWYDCGNGVWVGDAVTALLPRVPDSDGGVGGTLSLWCRGYDAAGNLVCAYDPTADWPVPSTE